MASFFVIFMSSCAGSFLLFLGWETAHRCYLKKHIKLLQDEVSGLGSQLRTLRLRIAYQPLTEIHAQYNATTPTNTNEKEN